jgi:hypothetical protein
VHYSSLALSRLRYNFTIFACRCICPYSLSHTNNFINHGIWKYLTWWPHPFYQLCGCGGGGGGGGGNGAAGATGATSGVGMIGIAGKTGASGTTGITKGSGAIGAAGGGGGVGNSPYFFMNIAFSLAFVMSYFSTLPFFKVTVALQF